jgi:hypothetical protein
LELRLRQADQDRGPGLGQVELAVDHRVPAGTGVDQVDRNLGVLDPACGAGVLALHPDRVHTLLEVSGLVDHEHPVGVAERADDVVAQVIAHSVGVLTRAGKQVLHAMWIRITGMLGDGPTILPRQIRQQAEHERPRPAAGLRPRKPPGHPIEQPVRLSYPPGSLYAVATA